MNRLTTADRTRAVACLVEGNSQRATCRIADLSRKAVARLSDDLGAACQRFANRVFVNLRAMSSLASSPIGRAILHGAARTLRPFRFALGISQRTTRPLETLLAL